MSDLAVVTLALAAAAGAWLAAGPHPLVGLGVAAAGMMTRRPWLVVVAVAVLASGLGQRAGAGLTPPEPAPFRGWVTLLSDPVDDDGRIRADVRLHGHHLEATIRGAAAASVAERLAGDRLFVAGGVGPPPPPAPWLAVRPLPAPRSLGDALAVTIAAQVGVAPVLVATFGGAPAAGLVANPLTVPAAGPVMMWGLSAGLVAGFVGGPVAALIHVPTLLLLAWAAAVADHA